MVEKPTRDDLLGLFDDILQGKSLEPHRDVLEFIRERMKDYDAKKTTDR